MKIENIGLKILALTLAVFLWYIISARGISEISIEVPIKYINIPNGLKLKRIIKKIKVNLLGRKNLLVSIKPESLMIIIDLKNTSEGEITYKIKKKDLKIPRGVSIINMNPSEIKIFLIKKGKK